jgi:hypothetical protein
MDRSFCLNNRKYELLGETRHSFSVIVLVVIEVIIGTFRLKKYPKSFKKNQIRIRES